MNNGTDDNGGCYLIAQSVFVQPYTFMALGIFRGLLFIYLSNRFTIILLRWWKSIGKSYNISVINTTDPDVIDQMNEDAVDLLKLMKVTPSPAAVWATNCALVELERQMDSEALTEDPVFRNWPPKMEEKDNNNGASSLEFHNSFFKQLAQSDSIQYSLHDEKIKYVHGAMINFFNDNLLPMKNMKSSSSSSLQVHGSGPVLASRPVIYDAAGFGSLVPIWWLQLLSACSIIFSFLSFFSAALKDEASSGGEHSSSGWERYQGLYARVSNSGMIASALTVICINGLLKFLQKYLGALAHIAYVETVYPNCVTRKQEQEDDDNNNDEDQNKKKSTDYSETASLLTVDDERDDDDDDDDDDDSRRKHHKRTPKSKKKPQQQQKKANRNTNNVITIQKGENNYETTLNVLRYIKDPLRCRDPILGIELSNLRTRVFFYTLLLLLPSIITHSIPMFIIYIWVPVLLLIVLCVIGLLVLTRGRPDRIKEAFENGLAVSVVSYIFCVTFSMFLELSFNWAVLFYKKDELGLSYIGVLQKDFESRNIKCWTVEQFNGYVEDVQHVSRVMQVATSALP